MPTLFPASPIWGDQRTIHYKENTSFTITFVTEKAAVEPYLPPGIVVPDDPLVMVTYCMCRGIKEMGGTGYNPTASASQPGMRARWTSSTATFRWSSGRTSSRRS